MKIFPPEKYPLYGIHVQVQYLLFCDNFRVIFDCLWLWSLLCLLKARQGPREVGHGGILRERAKASPVTRVNWGGREGRREGREGGEGEREGEGKERKRGKGRLVREGWKGVGREVREEGREGERVK